MEYNAVKGGPPVPQRWPSYTPSFLLPSGDGMTRFLALTVGLALSSPAAVAAGLQAKTMRDTLSAREVERPLVIGMGWIELGLGTDVKIADGYWSADGEPVDFEEADWMYSTQRLDIRYGVTRRGELYWFIRTHYTQLTNEERGTDTSYFGLGDPHFGYRFEAWRSMAPLTSVVFFADYKAPAGNESPGNYVGGPDTWSAVVLSTGTPDATFGVDVKRQVGPLAVRGSAAYVRRISNLAQYIIETELNQFAGRIKPGDITRLDGDLTVQLGPVALLGGARFQAWKETRIGSTAEGLFLAKNLVAVPDSDGWSLDARTGLTFHVTRGIDVVAQATVPMRGEDLLFFPIEELSPTRGNTYSGTLEFRY